MRVLAAKIGKFKGFRLHGMRPPTVCCFSFSNITSTRCTFCTRFSSFCIIS
jgi:hypothetical protein